MARVVAEKARVSAGSPTARSASRLPKGAKSGPARPYAKPTPALESPKDGARRAKAEMYRRLILEAAEVVFAERGFDEAKMQDIAQGAGIALGTLYSVFPGKSELYTAIQESRGQEMIQGIYSAIQGFDGVVDACQRGIDAYVRVLVERPHFLRMHLREGLSWTDPSSMRSGIEVATWERGMGMAVELLRAGIERGFFYASRPELLLKMMVATHQVQLTDWLERGARASDVAALITDMQQHFVRAYVRGTGVTERASG